MEKVALVTGSSRGIGRGIALRLARQGYAVCVNCRVRMDKAEETAREIIACGGRAMVYQADVSDAQQVRDMVAAVREKFGPITALVNNAGIAGQQQFQDLTEERWHEFFATNVDGAFHTTQAVLPDMLHAKSGAIVNIASIWGVRGASCEVAYSCTKHAIVGLTRSLAMELAPSGIRVNCVAPGVISTDMLSLLPEDVIDDLAVQTPAGRLGSVEDIAAAVTYFVSDEASFATGQVLTVDGGFIG
jgi:3-oxoacyl-[acyl-carrier protein] reductase